MAELRFDSRMSDSDALMWNIEKDPLLRSTITVVTLLDRVPDRAAVLARIDRGSRLIPRMRQRVVGNIASVAPPRWEYDPNFELRYHVRWVNGGGRATRRDVLDIAEPMAMQGFDRARPLWEFVLVEGLEGGGAALIQKLHHAITDGVGGMELAMVLLDHEREPARGDEELPPLPDVHVMSPAERTVDAVGHVVRRNLGIARRARATLPAAALGVLRHPAEVVRGLGEGAASVGRMVAPASEPMSPVMRARSLSVRFEPMTFGLADLKSAARRADGTLNDAFLVGVAGGLRRYHDNHGTIVDQLRVNMPINVRDDTTRDVAGNQFAPARFPVPLFPEDPIEHMRVVHRLVDAQRHEPSLALIAPMAGVLNRLPTTVTTAVFGSMLKGVDFTTSNVPGAPIPLYLCGARIEAMFPFGPLAGAALNVTLLSNCDDVHVGVNTDAAAVPDPELLHECLRASFDELLKLS